jgi:hypothetical protein
VLRLVRVVDERDDLYLTLPGKCANEVVGAYTIAAVRGVRESVSEE